jgi:mono/diheme cytochrome c family protein
MAAGIRVVAGLAPALAVLLSGCSVAEGLRVGFPTASRIGRGESVARNVCAACHAVRPGQASARSGAPTFMTISRRYTPRGLDRELDAIAEVGHYGMPVIRITPNDQRDLITYIASLRPPAADR